jgi:dipeptidyl aminopeptidase/acylaminoacyl peptidase
MKSTSTAKKRPIEIEDLYELVDVADPQISPNGQWIAHVRVSLDRMKNTYVRNIWLAPTDGGQPIQLSRSGKESEPRWSPDGQWLAFTSSRDDKAQVYLLRVSSPGGEARQLTAMPNGATSPAWSPDSRQIAFLSAMNVDERATENAAQDIDPPRDELAAKHRKERQEFDEKKRLDPRIHTQLPYRTGTAFLDDRFKQVYIFSIDEDSSQEAKKPRRLTDIDADCASPQWTPDGLSILTTHAADSNYDEPWRWQRIFRIDVETGEKSLLSDEATTDLSPYPSPDRAWIAFSNYPYETSSRSNPRLAIMRMDGSQRRDLTLEFDRSIGSYVWSPDSNHIFLSANSDGNTCIYAISVADGTIQPILDAVIEIQNFDVGQDGGIAYSCTTPQRPPELFWQPSPSSASQQLTHYNRAYLEGVAVQETHELRFQSADRSEIQGWYLMPADFEEGKQYPLILAIHGGPHVMWGPSTKTMWHEWQAQAAQGYVVFYCNPRGSDGYGETFRDGIFGAWGTNDMPDQMAGVEAMIDMGFVDRERLVITGGSYGGYMTGWMVGHSKRFKAAVAQRGVYHLMGFYGSCDIPQFVLDEIGVEPWEDVQKLWDQSPVAYAQDITTPLLLIHSENDYRVPISDGELFFALMRRLGKVVKMVRYPRDGHELSRSGEPEHRVSRLEHMMEWFNTYVMDGTS